MNIDANYHTQTKIRSSKKLTFHEQSDKQRLDGVQKLKYQHSCSDMTINKNQLKNKFENNSIRCSDNDSIQEEQDIIQIKMSREEILQNIYNI